jgi:hypothetical protein
MGLWGRPAKYRSNANLTRYSRQRAERTPPPRRSWSWQAAGTGVNSSGYSTQAPASISSTSSAAGAGRLAGRRNAAGGVRSRISQKHAVPCRPYPISSSSSPLCRSLFSRLPSSKPRYCMQFLVAGSDYCPRLMICFLLVQ